MIEKFAGFRITHNGRRQVLCHHQERYVVSICHLRLLLNCALHNGHAAGEIHEFKEELRSTDRGKKKETVKKVIAAMTVGKDVSVLFPDVVNCMQTEDLELKKLVYLYLINYAKTQPDLAIMAVNTFVKVTQLIVHSSIPSSRAQRQSLRLFGLITTQTPLDVQET